MKQEAVMLGVLLVVGLLASLASGRLAPGRGAGQVAATLTALCSPLRPPGRILALLVLASLSGWVGVFVHQGWQGIAGAPELDPSRYPSTEKRCQAAMQLAFYRLRKALAEHRPLRAELEELQADSGPTSDHHTYHRATESEDEVVDPVCPTGGSFTLDEQAKLSCSKHGALQGFPGLVSRQDCLAEQERCLQRRGGGYCPLGVEYVWQDTRLRCPVHGSRDEPEEAP